MGSAGFDGYSIYQGDLFFQKVTCGRRLFIASRDARRFLRQSTKGRLHDWYFKEQPWYYRYSYTHVHITPTKHEIKATNDSFRESWEESAGVPAVLLVRGISLSPSLGIRVIRDWLFQHEGTLSGGLRERCFVRLTFPKARELRIYHNLVASSPPLSFLAFCFVSGWISI